MELPVTLLAESVGEGNIYFFTNDCPIGVPEHMHVCIKKADEILIFSTCSSQIDTAYRLAKYKGWDMNTFPVIKADDTNKFTQELTYLDCNNVRSCSLGDFSNMLKNGQIQRLQGNLTPSDLEMIANGVKLSTVVPKNIQNLF